MGATVSLLCACTPQTPFEKVLDSAGANRKELQAVLKHYENDSLKLEAARFLIENMEGAYSIALLRLKDCKNPQREHHRIFLYEEGKVVWM